MVRSLDRLVGRSLARSLGRDACLGLKMKAVAHILTSLERPDIDAPKAHGFAKGSPSLLCIVGIWYEIIKFDGNLRFGTWSLSQYLHRE